MIYGEVSGDFMEKGLLRRAFGALRNDEVRIFP